MSNSSDPEYNRYAELDFADAQPVSAIPALANLQAESGGKTRITMRLDNDVLAVFKARAEMSGGSYQSLINQALREAVQGMTLAEVVRKAIRDELHTCVGWVERSETHPTQLT